MFKNFLIGQMLKSKKFWYAVSSIVVPLITLVVGQGIADSARK